MIIIQEKLSSKGDIVSAQIDAQDIRLGYSKVKPSNKFEYVIWTTTPRGNYPIIFSSERLQLQAYELLFRTGSDQTIVLDLNKYFFEEILPDNVVQEYVKVKLQSHLRNCLTYLLKEKELYQVQQTAAFRHISLTELVKISNGDKVEVERKEELWAKTLYTPTHLLKVGVTPLQFYKFIT